MSEARINKKFLIVLLGILAALGPFSIDMYIPGFQRIAEVFATDEKNVAFTLTSFFIGIALGQLIYGPLVDKFGRKPPLITGLLIYAIASIVCAYAPDIKSLIAMRFMQALGSCVGMVAANAIISDVYEVKDRAKAFSYIMLVMGVAPLIAPSMGGVFIEFGDWYHIFYFLAGFAAFIATLIFFFLPETNQSNRFVSLKINHIFKEYFVIFKDKTFFYYTMAGSISNSILFAYISSASFIFMSYYGVNKRTFSMLFAVNASGLISGSYINGILTRYYNYVRIATVASSILFVISLIGLLVIYLYPNLPFQYLVTCVFLILFDIGFISPNATAASLAPFIDNAGSASALGGSVRMGIGAFVSALIGFFQSENLLPIFIIVLFLAFASMVLLRLAYSKTDIASKIKI